MNDGYVFSVCQSKISDKFTSCFKFLFFFFFLALEVFYTLFLIFLIFFAPLCTFLPRAKGIKWAGKNEISNRHFLFTFFISFLHVNAHFCVWSSKKSEDIKLEHVMNLMTISISVPSRTLEHLSATKNSVNEDFHAVEIPYDWNSNFVSSENTIVLLE